MVVIPGPWKETQRRPQLFLAGSVSYWPSSARVLIVAHLGFSVLGLPPFGGLAVDPLEVTHANQTPLEATQASGTLTRPWVNTEIVAPLNIPVQPLKKEA